MTPTHIQRLSQTPTRRALKVMRIINKIMY